MAKEQIVAELQQEIENLKAENASLAAQRTEAVTELQKANKALESVQVDANGSVSLEQEKTIPTPAELVVIDKKKYQFQYSTTYHPQKGLLTASDLLLPENKEILVELIEQNSMLKEIV